MRVLVLGPTYQNQPKSVTNALSRMGNEAFLYSLTEFYIGCTYLEKKLYKLGVKTLEKRYNEHQAKSLKEYCDNLKPDIIFVLNGLMLCDEVLDIVKQYHRILWIWDSIKRCPKLMKILPFFKIVYVFEHDDVDYLNKYGWCATYLPLGYDDNIFYSKEKEHKDIDISFIGIPNEDRMMILNKIAKYAKKRKLKMYVGGPWYSKQHFWKKYQFKQRYPELYEYIDNHVIEAEDAADIYRRSKICLNINVHEHKSLNPRSFEILATNSFMLMNGNVNFYGLISDKDFEMFSNDDILYKIEEYINNEEKRKTVALHGYNTVKDKMSYIKILSKIKKEE